VVRGLAITNFGGVGLTLLGPGGDQVYHDVLQGNVHGDLLVEPGTNGNTIGGSTLDARLVAEGTSPGFDSIVVEGDGNRIQGVETDGLFIVGNHNLIGGTAPNARNVISGNKNQGGLRIRGSNNVVQGNFIGTDVTGLLADGNQIAGVVVTGWNNVIGGTQPGARNVIAGNLGDGVKILGSKGNVVEGNWIGLNADGAVLGNTSNGIEILGFGKSQGNVIGGTVPGSQNVISGNFVGVKLDGAVANIVEGNLIGTLADGVTPAGNRAVGVVVTAGSVNNSIGGTTPGAGNTIAFSQGVAGFGFGTGSGVLVQDDFGVGTTGTAILGNSIFHNAGLGIDELASAGAAPTLTSATSSSSGTVVTGKFHGAANQVVRIELFSNPSLNPSNAAEGKSFLGFVVVTTDANGNASFKTTLVSQVPPGQFITATATPSGDNTSQFSQAVLVKSG
jgi:titin